MCDENGVARPTFLKAGAHPRDFHEKSVEAEALFELPVVPRRPDGERSAGTEGGKRRGNASIVVESRVVGGRERPRAVVRVEQRGVKAAGVRAQRETTSVGIIMADVDHFKSVNDSRGHAAGDVVLRIVSSEIAAAVRTDRRTVDQQVRTLSRKLGVQDRYELALYGLSIAGEDLSEQRG